MFEYIYRFIAVKAIRAFTFRWDYAKGPYYDQKSKKNFRSSDIGYRSIMENVRLF